MNKPNEKKLNQHTENKDLLQRLNNWSNERIPSMEDLI